MTPARDPEEGARRALPGAAALFAALALHLVLPLAPEAVLVTGDLHNHVRHVHEAGLALAQGQFPPVVAPELNQRRLRLFQLYSGTAFLLPGALSLAMDAYAAFRLSIFLASFGAALAAWWLLGRVCRDRTAVLVPAAALQLASFPTHDLLQRGSLTEWLSLQLAVVSLAAAYALLGARSPAAPFCLTAAAVALFVPCHPVQTLLLGATGGAVLVLHAVRERRAGRAARLGLLVLAGSCGLALSAWYWLPILRHWTALKMTTWPAAAAWGAYFTHLDIVLWPWARGFHLWPAWTPQLGAPLFVGLAGATLWGAWRRDGPMRFVVFAGWLLVFLIVSPRWLNRELPWLVELLGLRRLQYSYRLLLPLSLLAALALAWTWANLRRRAWLRTRSATAAALAVVVVHSLPYVWGVPQAERSYSLSPGEVAATAFEAPNSSFYGLVGADFSRLGWVGPGGLRLGEALALPPAALPFDVRMEAGAPAEALRVEVDGVPLAIAWRQDAGRALVEFGVAARPAHVIRFDGPPRLEVSALWFRPRGDARWLALPTGVERLPARGSEWRARVRVERAGPYQLPVAWFPGDRLTVDGQPAAHVSADRFLVVVDLAPGEHVVESHLQRDPAATAAAGLALVVMAALVVMHARRRRLVAAHREAGPC